MEDRIYGLLGRKLGHSYSPAIHAQLGDAAYRCIELEPDQLGEFLKRDDIGGLNVTIPYKRDVLPFCTWTSESVRQIGAANTLVKRDGKLYAYNTDKPGFMEMTRRSGISVEEAKVLVLGSGGASLAVKAGLSSMGAAQIITISRSGENNYDNISRHYDADVIVTPPRWACARNAFRAPFPCRGSGTSAAFSTSYTTRHGPVSCFRRRNWEYPTPADSPCWWPRPSAPTRSSLTPRCRTK